MKCFLKAFAIFVALTINPSIAFTQSAEDYIRQGNEALDLWFKGNHRWNGNVVDLKFREVINLYNKAIDLNPTNADAYFSRGTAYYFYYFDFALEEEIDIYMQLARKDLTTAIELNPKYAEAYSHRADVNADMGNVEQAIQDLKSAARLGDKMAQEILEGKRWSLWYKKK